VVSGGGLWLLDFQNSDHKTEIENYDWGGQIEERLPPNGRKKEEGGAVPVVWTNAIGKGGNPKGRKGGSGVVQEKLNTPLLRN